MDSSNFVIRIRIRVKNLIRVRIKAKILELMRLSWSHEGPTSLAMEA
jgi:hypothetical protein